MTTIKKNDFIEIEFTGKVNDQIFDTTNPEQAKQIGLETNIKPIIISVGNQMLLQGFDQELEGKETGKKYSVHLTPEKAFGKRNPSLIRTIPIKVFREKDINPVPGMAIQLDNAVTKIISVSGGRVMVDFNNPLAGKEIDYEFTIKRKVEDDKGKINALQDFFFKKRFEFEINQEGKNKKVIFKDEKIKTLIEMMKSKFKDMTGFDFEVKKRGAKEDKKQKGKKNTNQETKEKTYDKKE